MGHSELQIRSDIASDVQAILEARPRSAELIYIGIDPGAKGAVVCLSDDVDPLLLLSPAPSAVDYVGALRECLALSVSRHAHCIAALEKTSARPGQGVVSMHQFGRNAGWWEGALAALSIPYLLAAPRRWQPAVLDSGGDPPKIRSLAMARRLWPHLTLGKNDDGLADALHLARWCRLQHRAPDQKPDTRSTVSRVLR